MVVRPGLGRKVTCPSVARLLGALLGALQEVSGNFVDDAMALDGSMTSLETIEAMVLDAPPGANLEQIYLRARELVSGSGEAGRGPTPGVSEGRA